MRRTIVTLAITLVLVLGLSVPALADVWKFGYISCSGERIAFTKALASGQGGIAPPGGGYSVFDHGGVLKWTTPRYANVGGGGDWFVHSNATLSNSTYSACSQYT